MNPQINPQRNFLYNLRNPSRKIVRALGCLRSQTTSSNHKQQPRVPNLRVRRWLWAAKMLFKTAIRARTIGPARGVSENIAAISPPVRGLGVDALMSRYDSTINHAASAARADMENTDDFRVRQYVNH